MPKVTFLEAGKKIGEYDAADGANIRRVALDNKVPIHHEPGLPQSLVQILNCHGFGHCGTCHVYIKKGAENCSPVGTWEKLRLSVAMFNIGHESECRLSCQAKVHGDVEVEIHPPLNLFGTKFWQ